MRKFTGLIAGAVGLVPTAAGAATITDLSSLFQFINSLTNVLLPLIIGLAVLSFVWGVFQTIASGGDPEKRKEGIHRIIWGIIAIVVMVSVWGLVNIVTNTIGVDNTIEGPPAVPTLPQLI